MFVMSRRQNERMVIEIGSASFELEVVRLGGNKVQLGFDDPDGRFRFVRKELREPDHCEQARHQRSVARRGTAVLSDKEGTQPPTTAHVG